MACHTCDRRSCVRPAHLYLGDAATNREDWALRGPAHERYGDADERRRLRRPARRPRPPQPLETIAYGERQPNAKLTNSAVRIIRAERAAGATYRALAVRFDVTPTAVRLAAIGERWGHIASDESAPVAATRTYAAGSRGVRKQ